MRRNSHFSRRFILLVLGLFAALARTGWADTSVSGVISVNTTWSLAGSPYIVTGDVTVQGSPTPILTIQAGVTVKFNANTSLTVGNNTAGELQAVGTSTQRILFTANTASPAAGFWRGIHLTTYTTNTSRISYATVEYGGWTGNRAGIHTEVCSPTLQNLTVRNNAHAGIGVRGGSPTIAASTLTSNPWGVWIRDTATVTVNGGTTISNNTTGGIYLWATLAAPPTVNLQTVSIINNTGYAISQDPKVTLGTVSGLTVSGNTVNAVEIRANYLDVNTTWKKIGFPYVITGGDVTVQGSPTPTLTIAAGVTVKFNANTALRIGYNVAGKLTALGTNASRITLTANTATPSPGFWRGVHFFWHTVATSKLAYATVSFAGWAGNYGGIHLTSASPALDHVRLASNAYAGVVANQSTATIEHCDFTSNTAGIVNQTPTTLLTARLNWWNAATGPSGSGPGSGQSVTAGVKFEPWLTASASAPQFVQTFTHTNPIFNPAQAIHTTTSFTTPQSGNWTVTFKTVAGATVRQYIGSGTTATVTWDGNNGAGTPAANGTYRYLLESTAGANVAAPAFGNVTIDRSRPLSLAGTSLDNPFFSPNGDTVKDQATLSSTPNYTVSWTVTIKNGGGATVRTLTGSGAAVAAIWNGKNGTGAIQPDAAYSMNLSATAGSATVTDVRTTTLDRTLPAGAITDPAGASTVSNVYRSGATAIPVRGSATDANFQNWTLEYGAGNPAGSFTQFGTGTTAVSAATFADWLTTALANGPYQLRLKVNDLAGNTRTTLQTLTLGHFRVTANTYEIKRAVNGTGTLSSIIPFTLRQTLIIKSPAGATVRTLLSNVTRNPNTYADVWNGRGPAGEYYPDGAYFYVSTVTTSDNLYTYTQDLTNTYANDFTQERHPTQSATFDPFSNQPLSLTFLVEQPSRLSILFAPQTRNIPDTCAPPHICFVQGRYTTSGTKTYTWAGTDNAGVYRPETRGVAISTTRTTFPKNTLVLDGTAPGITGVRLTPSLFSPSLGNQTIEYTLSTFQSQASTVTITYLHQDTLTMRRTMTFTSQTPGAKSHAFDGRADDGEWLPPGHYTVTVRVTDPLGNTESGQMLTAIEY